MGILNEAQFTRGEIESDYQFSQYVKSLDDLKVFEEKHENMKEFVKEMILFMARDVPVILYQIKHRSQRMKRIIIDGYLVTDVNHKCLWRMATFYEDVAIQLIDKAYKQIVEGELNNG